jgi:hypothetical protein
LVQFCCFLRDSCSMRRQPKQKADKQKIDSDDTSARVLAPLWLRLARPLPPSAASALSSSFYLRAENTIPDQILEAPARSPGFGGPILPLFGIHL